MKRTLRSAFNTRQYMLSQDFEIFYYSDLHFKPVGEHHHDYYEFYLFLEGDVTMVIKNLPYTLKEGDLVLVPPGVRHHALIKDSDTPYRRFVLWISRDYCDQLRAGSPDYVYMMKRANLDEKYVFRYTSNGFHMIQSKFLRLLEEMAGDRFGRENMIPLCLNDLILTMNRSVYEDEHPKEAGEETDLFQNLTSYIEAHLDEELSLDSIAEKFYVSKYYIAHYFKKNLGISIHQYIMKKRLDGCAAAYLAGENISKAYLRFGFGDYSSFYRAFRSEYGMSPKEYKETRSFNIYETAGGTVNSSVH